ncbi:hypothetical protein [Caldimonas manganoxidans]|jgi:hypothetical protein|uniref:hypothetical protein n=1 Tax=Caldimonas manganoxidans TaxID=196015 RepID=UPI00037EAA73|nr:hypothetical protein [Caldimonas manganoxidans]
MRLSDIAQVLGCSVPTASLLRNGRYGEVAKDSQLPERYAALVRLVEEARAAATLDTAAICRTCPREDCTGCRVAEL